MSNYPAGIDDEATLLRAVNNKVTTLTGGITISNVDIPIANASGLQAESGVVSIDDEVILYSFIDSGGSTPVLRACTRGYDGTPAQAHANGARVEARWVAKHHNSLVDAILAIENALGTDIEDGHGNLATRLSRTLPEVIAVSPPTRTWTFSHDKRRIVGVQLWKKMPSNQYEQFTASISQEVNPSGAAYVTIDLGAGNEKEGFIVVF